MYLDYYGLTEKPFNLTPDPKFFFASGSHAEARDLIRYGVREREGFLAITGAIGTGKTTVLRTVLEGFGREVVTALVLNPFLSEEDLLRIVLVDFGVATREELSGQAGRRLTKQDLIDRLNDHLLALSSQGRAAVLVIDEAQNLPLPVLEQVRLLSNLETNKEKLLQIVLAGQLGLRDLLASPKLRQLNQRISIRFRLQPLDTQEIGRYVDHRLRVAGSEGDIVFTDGALERMHAFSQGVPRLVNLIADRALLAGYAQRTREIGPEMIDRAADTLDLNRPGGAPVEPDPDSQKDKGGWLRRILLGTTAVAGLMAGGFLLASGAGMPGTLPSSTPDESRASAQAVLQDDAGGSDEATAKKGADEWREVRGDVESRQDSVPPADDGDRRAGDYTVYLSSFKSPEDPELENLRWKLSRSGFDSRLVEVSVPGQGTLFRLVVGDFTDSESARRTAGNLQDSLGVTHARAVSVAEVVGS